MFGGGDAARAAAGEADTWGGALRETFLARAFPPILEVVPGKRMKVAEVAPAPGEPAPGPPAEAAAATTKRLKQGGGQEG